MTILNTDLDKFSSEGYVFLKNIFEDNDFKSISNYFNSEFKEYHEGILKSSEITRNHPFYLNSTYYDNKQKIRIDGIPLKHRIFRGQGSPNLLDTPNIFYGKRFSKNIIDVKEELYKNIFNQELLKVCKSLLKTDALLFLEGSVNRTYPKYTGESMMLHIDTYGFSFGENKKRKPEDFFINILVYVNGSNEGRSPTKIIPKSHLYYEEINEIVANSSKKDKKFNCIHQRELYEDLIPELTKNLVTVDAQPGDILIINSNLVHGIPENTNDEKHRDVIILNFASQNQYFGKQRNKSDLNLLNSRISKFNLKAINEKLFAKVKRKLISNIKKTYKKFTKINEKIETYRKIDLEKKNYLNLGSGPSFFDENTISLDYLDDPHVVGHRVDMKIDINFDLSSFEKLPFRDNRFYGIYTSHCFEHLTDNNVEFIMKECFRILKPGGILRVVVPNIDKYFDAYDKKDLFFFNWIRNKMPYKLDSWLRFITREFACNSVDDFSDRELINMYEKLSRKEYIEFFSKLSNSEKDPNKNIPDIHKSYWNKNKLNKFFQNCNFTLINEKKTHQSSLDHFKSSFFDNTRPNISIYFEGSKGI